MGLCTTDYRLSWDSVLHTTDSAGTLRYTIQTLLGLCTTSLRYTIHSVETLYYILQTLLGLCTIHYRLCWDYMLQTSDSGWDSELQTKDPAGTVLQTTD